jgi:arylsulfatase A-like enzyme
MQSAWRSGAALGALCVVVAACTAHEGQPIAQRHLADEAAAERDLARPPTATLGATTRYVLGPALGRWQSLGTGEARGQSHAEVACNGELAGSPVLVEFRLRSGRYAEDVENGIALGRRCPADPASPLRVDFTTRPIDFPVERLARVSPIPSPLVTTIPFEATSSQELRFAVGAVGASGARPLRIAVRAVGPTGRRLTLLRTSAASDDRWHEHRVSLAAARAALGGTVRLEFKRETSRDTERLACLMIADPTIWGPETRPSDVPARNVLLVSLDTLRADRLGAYGYPLAVSPVLDTLAREGTLFARAFAQASWTVPSHATMLTGTYPCVHGLGFDESNRNAPPERLVGSPLAAGVRPLAEILRAAGYHSAAFTEDGFVDPGSFQRGFDEFTANKHGGRAAGVVEETVRSSVEWLRAHAGERFFLFVHTYQVHEPYTPPPAYEWLAGLRELPVPPGALPPAPQYESDAAKYTAEVAYTDASLAPLFAALADLGVADRTIVIVTSDHGEAFGEQGAVRHGNGITEEEIHVPLIWRAPGLIAAGRRIESMVGVVDIAPTVLALLGLPSPDWMQGRSVAPMLALGPPARDAQPRLLPVEGFAMQGVRGSNWKAARRRTAVSVKAVSSSGVESKLPGPSSTAKRMARKAFGAIAEECERARDALGAAGLMRPAVAPEVDRERERKLRALGYLE